MKKMILFIVCILTITSIECSYSSSMQQAPQSVNKYTKVAIGSALCCLGGMAGYPLIPCCSNPSLCAAAGSLKATLECIRFGCAVHNCVLGGCFHIAVIAETVSDCMSAQKPDDAKNTKKTEMKRD